ncbi:MAG: IS200/IS605 family transposase [Bacteroidota bacterium]|nr:IS200/IS605 family transposase [Bacteroidota bacterium]
MPNTYTQLYIQFVFAFKWRESLIQFSWKDELYKYITGIVQNNKSKMLAINGMPDHIHIFVGYKPSVPIPDLIKDIKVASSLWINERKLANEKFNWQEGYGAFLYRLRDVDEICKYIQNQESHHHKKPFREEYRDLLNDFAVEYEDKYLFEFFDDIYSTPTELGKPL